MHAPRIVAFSGSARIGSYNMKLLQIAAAGARSAGADVLVVDFRDVWMPLYDADLEEREGIPENAKKFKRLLIEHDGFLIASPENNSSVSALLKNAIDWASREEREDEPALLAFRGKTAAIMAASPGALGGLRGLVHLRAILGNIGVLVLPDQVTLPKANAAFDEADRIADERKQKSAEDLGAKLAQTIRKLCAE